MKILVIITLAKIVFGQDTRDDAIDAIFSTNSTPFDFLDNYEEITPPPLKSIGALTKCGEGEQLNKFVCVPYYNCNPTTNMVEENPEIDGSRIFDVRMGESDPKCDHYLEVCCQVVADDGNNVRSNTSRPVTNPTTTKPSGGTDSGSGGTGAGTGGTGSGSESGNSGSEKPTPRRVNCGIRNNKGLDFNLIGGTNEANFGEFPWMVAILRKNPGPKDPLAVCGGSLIGPKVVLTGAHCVHNINVNDIKVRAGEWDTQTQNERIPYQERNVSQKFVHEFFIRSNLYNDIALLILDRPFIKTDSVGTICLPQDQQHFDSRECFATGWGKDIFGQQGQYAVILKKIQMPLVQNKNCQTALRKTRLGSSFKLHHSFICAGGEPNLDTCTGDGGSPLVCPDPNNPKRYLQVGIVAWGIGCGEQQVPGVYGDVSTFRSWIDTKLLENGLNTESYTL